MAAPNGNRFWELRSKHGKDRIFTTPEIMWEAAVEYFNTNEDNPRFELDFRGKDATPVSIPKLQPLSMEGLCLFLGVDTSYFRQFKLSLAGKSDEIAKDYLTIITRIEETVFKQQYDGAASGFLNGNIIARKLGLTEKIESKVDATVTQPLDYSKLSDEALKEIENAAKDQPRLS